MIKVIKRNTSPELPNAASKTRRQKRRPMTATVNDWIVESRRNRVDTDSSSRETIERWTSAAEN